METLENKLLNLFIILYLSVNISQPLWITLDGAPEGQAGEYGVIEALEVLISFSSSMLPLLKYH